jgi:3-dehydroquinate synthase
MEVIKHGLISDKGFFVWLEKNLKQILSLKPQFIERAIKRSIEIKADVVSKDEKENGLRAILNFGHTFGHALETIGNNKLYTHGEAVALGMLAATKLSESISDLDPEVFDRVHSTIKNTGIKVKLKKKIVPKKLITLMQSDKKKNNSQLKFILLEKIGKAKIKSVSNEVKIENAIKNSLFY